MSIKREPVNVRFEDGHVEKAVQTFEEDRSSAGDLVAAFISIVTESGEDIDPAPHGRFVSRRSGRPVEVVSV